MNIAGALLFLAIVLALFSSTREEKPTDTPDLVALECQRRTLEEDIAAKRTTLAVFTTLTQDIENLRRVKEDYEREICTQAEDYQRLVARNEALNAMYGAFSEAWKESEQA